MLSRLQGLGNHIEVTLPKDDRGFLGRECPVNECTGHFSIKPGTGLTGSDLQCYCPYCGHQDKSSSFSTKDQVEYVRSVMSNKIRRAFQEDMKDFAKKLEYRSPRQGAFGLNITTKFTPGSLPPIRYYREKTLETEVVCDSCTLNYTIYGVFGFCPDCGSHNSRQILEKNLDLAEKEIDLSATAEGDLASHLIGDALENMVSAFDGFGRETCRIHADKATTPAKAESISFQNLVNVRQKLQELFNFDIAQNIAPKDWDFICRSFQKRHLLAHKMGVVDEGYIKATNDISAIVGRKVAIDAVDVQQLANHLRILGAHLSSQF